MFGSENSFFRFCQSHSNRSKHIITGRAADDQHIHTAIMVSRISTNSQRAHAMAKKNQRKLREMIPDQTIYCMNILQHGICPAAIHISKIFFTPHTFSVAAVIVNHTYIFPFCHIFHKRNVAFLVLTHSVNDLYDPTVFLITFQLRHYC